MVPTGVAAFQFAFEICMRNKPVRNVDPEMVSKLREAYSQSVRAAAAARDDLGGDDDDQANGVARGEGESDETCSSDEGTYNPLAALQQQRKEALAGRKRKQSDPRYFHLRYGGYDCEELFTRCDDGSYVGAFHKDRFANEEALRAFVREKRGNDSTLVEIKSPAQVDHIKRADSGICEPTTTSMTSVTTTLTAALQTERPLSESLQTERTQGSAKSKKKPKKPRKLGPGVAHAISSAIRNGCKGNAPIGTRVVLAVDFADGDRNHGGLVRAIEKTVTSLEGPYVEFWGKSGVVNDAGVYTFIDETKTKPAPGGARGKCEPDLVVVSGHGIAGHLADSSVIGRWRLSDVAAEIVQRLPRVQVIVFALCNTDADKTIKAELRKISRGGGPAVVGMQGKIDFVERDRLVANMVTTAAQVGGGQPIKPAIAAFVGRERKLVDFAPVV